MAACEPCQDRKVAALSGYRHVPRGCLLLQLYKEIGGSPDCSGLLFYCGGPAAAAASAFISAGLEFLYNSKVM